MELTPGERFLTGSLLGTMGGILLAVVLVVQLPGDQYPVLLSNWGLFGVFMACWVGCILFILSPVFNNHAGQIFLFCLFCIVVTLYLVLGWWSVAISVASALSAAAAKR